MGAGRGDLASPTGSIRKKNNSGYVGQGTDKTAKSTEKGGFGGFGSPPSGESENIFSDDAPRADDDDGIDFEDVKP